MDVEGSIENLEKFKAHYPNLEIVPISAYTKSNLDILLYKLADCLDEAKKEDKFKIETSEVVEYNFVEEGPKFTITMDEAGYFNVDGPEVKKLFERTDFTNEVSIRQFARALRQLGVEEELLKQGAEPGETIIILGYEFEFIA